MFNRIQLTRALLVGLVLCGFAGVGFAQGTSDFGSSARADRARDAVVLAVEQGISSLPPTSGQSFAYEYDPTAGVFARSERLGTIAFRTPETIGQGTVSLRVAASYFEINDTLGPIDHLLTPEADRLGQIDCSNGQCGLTQFGTRIKAHVGLMNIGASYGILDRLEAFVNLPVVFNDVRVFQLTTGDPEVDPALNQIKTQPTSSLDPVPLAANRARLHEAIADGGLQINARSLGLPADPAGGPALINDGTHIGLGRVTLGTKGLVYAGGPVSIGASLELLLPSPNRDQFAGSDTTALLPRVIGAVKIPNPLVPLRFHADAGYAYDFQTDALRRFTWDGGFSIAASQSLSLDLGVGGSLYNSGIEWTPTTSTGRELEGNTSPIRVSRALEDNRLETEFVDFIGGLKLKLSDNAVLSGAVSVPVIGHTLRPAAIGTIALEVYL